jgi:hypothetical protein
MKIERLEMNEGDIEKLVEKRGLKFLSDETVDLHREQSQEVLNNFN